MELEWQEGSIHIEPPKKPKKITGTRLGAILGMNKWSSQFEAWCSITRVYEKPFEDNIYTTAGKVIEPKLIAYCAKRYFLDVQTPEDVFGKDFFNKTYGDFFRKESKIFGGMWDARTKDMVIEIKTTKRAEDWQHEIPPYYKLQASLYAYLMGLDKVMFCCGFLDDEDYEHPENFEPQTAKNVIIRTYRLSTEYKDFEKEFIEPAKLWWERHVKSGNSPLITDSKCDEDIVKELRKLTINDSAELNACVARIENLMVQIDEITKAAIPLEDELKQEQGKLKKFLQAELKKNPKMDKAEIAGGTKMFTLSKGSKESVDTDKLKKAGLYDTYKKTSTTYTLRNSDLKAKE